MEHIADRRSRVETADTGGSSDKQNSSTLQADPLITEQNQKNGFGPTRGNGKKASNKPFQHNQQLVPQRGLHKRSCSPVRELPKKGKLTQSSTEQQLVSQTGLLKRPRTSVRELPQKGSGSWEEKIPSVKRDGTNNEPNDCRASGGFFQQISQQKRGK